jgi:phosphatidylserine/phosphatidylglycerophosphate/cardiolipin synthase-like enzyme
MSPPTPAAKVPLTLKLHPGDAKTLIAYDLPEDETTNLAGFTIQVTPGSGEPYYLWNQLQFETPTDHAQVDGEPPFSSVNAPFHKFRWLHVPGVAHQGLKPFWGPYTYTVTPRYFDDSQKMLPLDATLSVSESVSVVPFVKNQVEARFTRGYVQSQGYVRHFGPKAVIEPKGHELLWDTGQQAGTVKGQTFSYRDEYGWLGATARNRVFELLYGVLADKSLSLDVFAYDLDEPDLCTILLKLADEGRIRIVLDNSSGHTTQPKDKAKAPEDQFEDAMNAKPNGANMIKRGKFKRFAHDKIMIVRSGGVPQSVLTGSTNFSISGLYVNANHLLVFTDPEVMSKYAAVFDWVWEHGPVEAFKDSDLAAGPVQVSTGGTPKTDFSFSPHNPDVALAGLQTIADRVEKEGTTEGGSVLFAVMQLVPGTGPVLPALRQVHEQQTILSYGISDSPGGIELYKPGTTTGLLVTGKPTDPQLPPPFSQVPSIAYHEIHHKFVVCGFNGDDPVVYCGSSNLALGGEEENGDNLLAIHDAEIATAFALEAVALVDRYHFLDSYAKPPAAKDVPPPAQPREAAKDSGAHLSTTDGWKDKFYDEKDLHFLDRQLFVKGT